MSAPLFQLRNVRKVYNGRQTLALEALQIGRLFQLSTVLAAAHG